MGILSGKIVSNSLWMMLEKVISIFGLIFVTSYVAKYIGPTNFGKIALATTVFTFVQTLTWFGNQEILFGKIEDFVGKFQKLQTFYKKIIPAKGWNMYKKINLKFENQIICD